MPTLAELRAGKPASLPTRVVKVCLDLEVLAEVQRLEGEKQDILLDAARSTVDDDEKSTRPRRQGEGENPRLAEIAAALDACYERIRASEGEVLLRAIPGGKWQRWKDEHPPREGNPSDESMAYGLCNATALMDDLGTYAAEWNGEPLADSDWSGVLSKQIAPADLGEMVKQVVTLHEVKVAAPPKSLRHSSPTEPDETA